MPKVVDPDTRRRTIIDAVFRLVSRDGVPAASLRNIAAEAGLNIGSVRHYFASADDLIEAAVTTMADEAAARIRARHPDVEAALAAGDHRSAMHHLTLMLEEVLPLDERRRAEATIWLAFTEWSRTRPTLRPIAGSLLLATRDLTTALADALGQPAEAGEALATCLDGLILAAVHLPEVYPPERQRAVLAHQLQTLLR